MLIKSYFVWIAMDYVSKNSRGLVCSSPQYFFFTFAISIKGSHPKIKYLDSETVPITGMGGSIFSSFANSILFEGKMG